VSAETNPLPSWDAGVVELSVPLQAQYAATVRTLAASLGADAGFSVDELDDIRLALSEVFSAMVDDAAIDVSARALVSLSVGAGVAHVEVRGAAAIDLDELALGILRSVTDEFEVTPTSVVFELRATEANTVASTS
jgi:hypothetical protein